MWETLSFHWKLWGNYNLAVGCEKLMGFTSHRAGQRDSRCVTSLGEKQGSSCSTSTPRFRHGVWMHQRKGPHHQKEAFFASFRDLFAAKDGRMSRFGRDSRTRRLGSALKFRFCSGCIHNRPNYPPDGYLSSPCFLHHLKLQVQ